MNDFGNQHDVGEDRNVSRVLEQWEIDEINMKNLNDANRLYRKCVSGKCPPPTEIRSNHNNGAVQPSKAKPENLITSKRQDKSLSKVWVEKGRDHRWKALKDELRELNTKISVATGKQHLTDHEKNFKAITGTIKDIESTDVQIKKAMREIVHLKSQFERVLQKKDELSHKTESEGISSKKV